MVVPDGPPDVAEHAEEHAQHEDEPELGLVYPAVSLGHPHDSPVVQRARDGHGEHDPNQPAEVGQALGVTRSQITQTSNIGWADIRFG